MQFRAGLIQQKNQAVRAVGSENRLRKDGAGTRNNALTPSSPRT
jgi:hypothetical protein